MPQLDVSTYLSQLFWLFVTFGFLYLLAKQVILPRIGQTLENRHRRIAEDLEMAERLRRQAEEALAEHDQLLAESRAQAQEMVRAERERITAELDARRKQLESELAARIAQAERELKQAKEAALAELEGTIDELASEIAARVVGKATGASASKEG